ncbi:MAG: transporter substrate-binding domain-containing protein [Flavobacteriales bacterium]
MKGLRRYKGILLLLIFTVVLGKSSHALKSLQDSAQKEELVVGVKPSPPFLIEGASGKIERGIAHDLWVKLAEEKDLNYRFERIDTLSGLLKALAQKRIDLCIAPLTVTSKRLEKIEFTQPFFISNLSIATRKEPRDQLLLFLRNFFSMDFLRTILLLFLIIFTFGLLLWGVERRKNPDMFRSGWRGMMDGFWWSAVTMTTVGYGDKAPTTALGKFIATIWMFTAVIIVSGFTATIASSLTVQQTQHGIEGLQDLAKMRTATVKGSNSADFLREKGIDPIEMPTLKKAIKALEHEKVKAVLYDEPLLRYAINEEGYQEEMTVLNQKFEEQHYSFGMPQEAPYAAEMNQALLKVLEGGDWERILHRYDL